MVRLLLFLLGTLTTGRPGLRDTAGYRHADPGGLAEPGGEYPRREPHRGDAAWQDQRTPVASWPPDTVRGGDLQHGPGRGSGPRRRRISPKVKWAALVLVVGLIFRRAIASVVLTALSAALHLVGINAHLPSISFAWPWQTITAGTTTDTDLGPWVLQKIEGISKPALGQANFNFLFTHKVSKSIGPWPCWYASTFYAVAHAAATVDLNPGPAWWAPARGHYMLHVLSRPAGGRPSRRDGKRRGCARDDRGAGGAGSGIAFRMGERAGGVARRVR